MKYAIWYIKKFDPIIATVEKEFKASEEYRLR